MDVPVAPEPEIQEDLDFDDEDDMYFDDLAMDDEDMFDDMAFDDFDDDDDDFDDDFDAMTAAEFCDQEQVIAAEAPNQVS